jgi:guanylate kinase
LEAAEREMKWSKEKGIVDCVIVNEDLDKAYKQLEEFLGY